MTAYVAVAGGATLLDCADPDWWREDVPQAIDLGLLNMGSDCYDVLGQRYGSYKDGLRFLGISQQQAEQVGFDSPWPSHNPSYPELTAEFARVIRERRERAA
jgi:hypothetical protein